MGQIGNLSYDSRTSENRCRPVGPGQLENILMEVLGLPTATRARLAEQLIKSLEHEEYPPGEEVTRRQLEVAEQRLADFEAGKVQGVPAEQVFRKLREKLG